ncbi:MAG: Rieske (2Fe-2S) protein [Cyanothece sp. SIO1E1]|nr:Rieske (2Fe-2S) protein [Cyanothece sp. SIO1E1]
MDRRTFLNWVGAGFIANCLPLAIAACSSGNSSQSSPGRDSREIGTVAQLDQEGLILNEQVADSPVLVVRDTNAPDTLVAINPVCTHRDCLVEWQKQKNVFLCTCHDSEFDTAGNVLGPPAKDPLTTYSVNIEGDRILIKNAESL